MDELGSLVADTPVWGTDAVAHLDVFTTTYDFSSQMSPTPLEMDPQLCDPQLCDPQLCDPCDTQFMTPQEPVTPDRDAFTVTAVPTHQSHEIVRVMQQTVTSSHVYGPIREAINRAIIIWPMHTRCSGCDTSWAAIASLLVQVIHLDLSVSTNPTQLAFWNDLCIQVMTGCPHQHML
jgi:hypothetical protein